MKTEQWELFLQTIHAENTILPVGLIVDSPWMPGYCKISTIDFFAQPKLWLDAYVKIRRDFPDILFLPDWWAEYGMATEPSGFGCKIDFSDGTPPTVRHIIRDADDIEAIDELEVPDPRKNGFMPLLLSQQRAVLPQIRDMGDDIQIVSTRGPLTVASHLMGVTEFLLLLKLDPDAAHRLLKKTAALCIRWLEAQLENVRDAEGVLVLDDLSGFLGKADYLEFAHPYLKSVFDAFQDRVRLFHNDTDSDVCFPYLGELGIDLFNPTCKKPIAQIRKLVESRIVILGSLETLMLVNGTAEDVEQATRTMIGDYASANNGSKKGLIVSTGGGAPMGARMDTIRAMQDAVRGIGV